jgi:hypothetical protein
MDTKLNEEPGCIDGIDASRLQAAREQLRSSRVWGIAISGKLASGKDTVAALVMDALDADRREHLSWATPLKDELDVVIDALRQAEDPSSAVQAVCALGLNTAQAQTLVSELWNESKQGVDARSRTPRIRWGLQYLGTDVRRAEDPDYWVRRAAANAVESVCEGRSVFFTDCRFPNEVEAARAIGLYTVRLEITAEMQESRLRGRDGLMFDPAAAAHPSETALDGYPGFDLVVDNNGLPVEAVSVIVAAVRARQLRF